MKSTQSTSTSWASSHQSTVYKLRPIILPSPPVKLTNGSSLKMRSRKRQSPKQHTTPLPSISTLFDSHSSCSLSSSSNSSYGSYCQFSPEGTYTMYNMPTTMPYQIMNNQEMRYDGTNVQQQMTTETPAMSVNEHKPVNQPLFIQTSDNYSHGGTASSYPTTSTINVSQLLLRPLANH